MVVQTARPSGIFHDGDGPDPAATEVVVPALQLHRQEPPQGANVFDLDTEARRRPWGVLAIARARLVQQIDPLRRRALHVHVQVRNGGCYPTSRLVENLRAEGWIDKDRRRSHPVPQEGDSFVETAGAVCNPSRKQHAIGEESKAVRVLCQNQDFETGQEGTLNGRHRLAGVEQTRCRGRRRRMKRFVAIFRQRGGVLGLAVRRSARMGRRFAEPGETVADRHSRFWPELDSDAWIPTLRCRAQRAEGRETGAAPEVPQDSGLVGPPASSGTSLCRTGTEWAT